MKKCPFCAEEVQDDAVLCKHCNNGLPKGRYCFFCRKTLPPGVRLKCPHCGFVSDEAVGTVLLALVIGYFMGKFLFTLLSLLLIGTSLSLIQMFGHETFIENLNAALAAFSTLVLKLLKGIKPAFRKENGWQTLSLILGISVTGFLAWQTFLSPPPIEHSEPTHPPSNEQAVPSRNDPPPAKKSDATEAKGMQEYVQTQVIVCAQQEVKAMLKSPRSAKFPWGNFEYDISKWGEKYLVLGYVDAQNSFGAMLRQHWQCRVTFPPPPADWTECETECTFSEN